MAIKLANAYDTNTKRWIGRVPVSWFERFPHLSHEGPAVEPATADEPSASWSAPQLRKFAKDRYGLRLPSNARKAQLLEAIAAAAADEASDEPHGDVPVNEDEDASNS